MPKMPNTQCLKLEVITTQLCSNKAKTAKNCAAVKSVLAKLIK